jgi:hypothetical protein
MHTDTYDALSDDERYELLCQVYNDDAPMPGQISHLYLEDLPKYLQAAIHDMIPKEFGLRAFPGKRFTVNKSASDLLGNPQMLYIYTIEGEAFCKGTKEELRKEMT